MSLAQEFLSGSIKHRNKVTPLPLGRLRVERWFDFDAATLRHAWHAAYGKDVALEDEDLTIKIFGGFGLLDGALPESPSALSGAYTKRAYKDCRLVEENCAPTKEEHQLYQAYETLRSTWDDEDILKIKSTAAGQMIATRVQVAIRGTVAPYTDDDVGVAVIHVLDRDIVDDETEGATGLILESFEDASSDRKGVYASQWVEPGILSESDDLVGSQKAKVINAIGVVPGAPAGYLLAKTGKNNVEGLIAYAYTFLKAGTGADPKLGVVLSRSRDKVASLQAVTFEVFDGAATAEMANSYGYGTGYVIADERASDVEGVPTMRYTFLQPSLLSEDEDNIGAQKSINLESFNLSEASTKAASSKTLTGHILAKIRESNVKGIPTKRFSYLKPNVILAKSSDKVGSQKAEVIEVFSPAGQPAPTNGGILAKQGESNVDGVPTVSYTFLKPSVLSVSNRRQNNGKLEVRTVEAFGQTPATPAGYVFVTDSASDYEGIPTRRYVFAKGEGEIRHNLQYRHNGKLELVDLTILRQGDNTYAGSAQPALSGYVLYSFNKSEAEGHHVVTASFAKGEGEIVRKTRHGPAGIDYLSISYLTAPTGTEPAIAAATVLTSTRSEQSGYLLWQLNAVDDSGYSGDYLVDDIRAQTDGALVVTRSGWNAAPVAPAGNFYLIRQKATKEDGGKKTVLCIWIQPPSAYSEIKSVSFKRPGWARCDSGQLIQEAGASKNYAATVSHTFTLAIGTAPALYNITHWAVFTVSYTAADGGEKYFEQKELPGYLGNSTWIGNNSSWGGIDCSVGTASIYSNPSSIPSGQQTIDYSSTPYLSSLSGQKVYRNTTVKITL